MKILVLTQPLGPNYGGIMQAYALQYFLKKYDIDIVTQNWNIARPKWHFYLSLFKRSIVKLFINSNVSLYNSMDYGILSKITVNTNSFISKKINLTDDSVFTNKRLDSYVGKKDYDAYIAGSDQCWACSSKSNYVKNCMFSFLKDKHNEIRISYAASFGKDTFCSDPKFISECKCLLKSFDAVSVREDSGVKLCKELFDIEAIQVLDPTMLLNAEHYSKISYERDDFINNGDLFTYILDEDVEKQSIIDKVVNVYNLKPFRVLPKAKYEVVGPKHVEDCVLPPVEQWLRGFVDAKYVITDSFHGTVFSILFKRPFIAIGNSSRGMTRFTSLLKLFGLEDRLIHKPEDVTPELINKPIDYEKVYVILEAERKKSKKFLMDALNIQK